MFDNIYHLLNFASIC